MSNTIQDVTDYAYATATGVLLVMTESFLLDTNPDKEISAKAFVNVVESTIGMPESVIKLKDEVKLKYNL